MTYTEYRQLRLVAISSGPVATYPGMGWHPCQLPVNGGLKANRTKKPIQKRFFPKGKDGKKRHFQDFRWQNFKNLEPRDMYTLISEHVFPWLRTLGGGRNDDGFSKNEC